MGVGHGVVDENSEKVQIVAVKAYREYYQIYEGGVYLKKEQKKNEDLLEREDVVFGDGDVCDENNTKCDDEGKKNEDMWKRGLIFPSKTPKWNDKLDDVMASFNSVFGFVGDSVGSGVSAVGSLLSSLFQIFFVVIVFM